MPVSLQRAREIFGNAPPPAAVHQRQFDNFEKELCRLARTPLEEIKRHDLWYYYHDLAYVELQPDLFAYLFPLCLWDWHLTLVDNEPCSHGDSEFHYGIAHGRVFEKMLTADQRSAVNAFLCDSLLEKLNRGTQVAVAFPYAGDLAWISRLNSLALVMPQIDKFWTQWWRIETCGQAISALQYLAGLMYFAEENPLFTAWPASTSDAEPFLVAHDSFLFEVGWQKENLQFLTSQLTVARIQEITDRSATALRGTSEGQLVGRIRNDFSRHTEIVESRIQELPALLAAGRLGPGNGWSL